MQQFDASQHTYLADIEQLASVLGPAFDAFVASPVHQLSAVPNFVGSGVYGIYLLDSTGTVYEGRVQSTRPIYIGKAVPTGWRQGRLNSSSSDRKLKARLMEHKRSIEATELDATRFGCRFLVMGDAAEELIGAMESYLIRKYAPLWNSYIDGFGNHDPGKGRYDQAPSEWDTLHSGRLFASRLRGTPPNIAAIKRKIENYT